MEAVIDMCMTQVYSYFYILLFLIGLFALVYFCCYGKKVRGKREFQWNDMFSSMSSWNAWRKPQLKKHETRSRLVFENIFQVPFKSVRPPFLKYIHGKNLELDGYNADLNIAFEYQGIQHRQFTPLFHKTYSDFQKQLARDEWKHQKCKERGIRLLCIPDTIKFDDVEDYIRAWVKENDLI
jgi:hypothetical protein